MVVCKGVGDSFVGLAVVVAVGYGRSTLGTYRQKGQN